ncbi:MAG TPA: serine protease [Kofleriaceae bacterium]|nr:serine protease [Kofleriaceae bacterium]
MMQKAGSLLSLSSRTVRLACAPLAALSLLGACALADEGEEVAGDPSPIEPKTVCGADDTVFVNDYRGTLGPTEAFVQTHKKYIGALEEEGTTTSRKYCTGSLIASNLFLTANHCQVSTSFLGKWVSFNYERAAGSTTLLTQSHYRVEAVVEAGLGADFAILRLAGSPGATWGIATVATVDPPVGAAITIMGHAKGGPKKIEAGTVLGFGTKTVQYNNVDTLGGQSGAPILDGAGQVVGVHTNGGCTTSGTGYNYGQRISTIRTGSAVL